MAQKQSGPTNPCSELAVIEAKAHFPYPAALTLGISQTGPPGSNTGEGDK